MPEGYYTADCITHLEREKVVPKRGKILYIEGKKQIVVTSIGCLLSLVTDNKNREHKLRAGN